MAHASSSGLVPIGTVRWGSRRRLALSAILLFLFSLALQYGSLANAPTALAAHLQGIFELDGNAIDDNDGAFPNDADWQNGPEGAADAFFVGAASEAAANDDTYFTTGGSKDENTIAAWEITTTGAPDKDELLDAYAAVYQKDGDTWVYFGADRFDNDGTAQIGFWFFQDDVAVVNGDFAGAHVNGDVLIISEYTNGGSISTICAYEWDSVSDGDNIDTGEVDCDAATNGSNLDLVAAGVACDVADGSFDICAVSNDAVATAPWTFLNKDNKTDFGKGQFFEGGLNLSDMFGGEAPCFGSFLAETRTSAETDAQLKDFALGDFNTCVPPTITTLSSAAAADFGQAVTDTATLSGNNGAVTGTVDFFICTPAQVTPGEGCVADDGTQVGSSVAIVAGSATSAAYNVGVVAAAAGTYCWRAEYNPSDGSNYIEGSHTNATSECFTVAPATIDVDKVANPAGPVEVGGQVGFDIVVTNTGDGTALGVSVTDSLPAGIVWTADAPTGDTTGVSCSINTVPNPDVLTCTDASMAADDSFTVHIHGVTDAGDCGTVNNSATVTTTNDGSDTDPASVVVACPSLTITKEATESSYDEVDDVIHYTITATNNGNVTLHNVVVTDAQVSDLDCTPATPVANLIAGASITCTASHTITQADLDAGSFWNQACADDGNGDGATGADPVCDDVTTPGTQNPHLTITKEATESTYDEVDDVIHYTVTATNDGNVTLHNVDVTDPNVGDLDCTPATPVADLAPGDSITCTASHTIVQADLDAGSFYNQACVDDTPESGPDADEACDDVTTPGDQKPSLTIKKEAAESSYDEVDDVINYTITATNNGNVTLHDVVVTDDQVSDLDCTPATPVADLAPGDSISCTASHTITQEDLDAGSFWNQACTDDGNGDGETGAAPACDDVTTPGTQNPSLTITKVDNTGSFDAVDDVISYTITATNNGNVTLHDVVVTDAQVSDLDCTPATPVADLAPGDSITCTASHTITQEDVDAGSFWNQACTDDGNGDGETGADAVCDDVTTPGSKNPHLAIVKEATESSFDEVGDVVHYTITATNDGNVTLHNVVVTDAQVTDLDCAPSVPVADLAPGGTITCTASHTIIQEDLDAGTFYNQACVDDGDGGAESQCDDVETPGEPKPSLAIVKIATESGYDSIGDVIHYTITATNDGNVTLHNVVVTDAQVTDLDCTPTTPVADLAPGDSITCTASHTITQSDLDAGSVYNQACTDDGNGDGETGADPICDDVETPGDDNPTLGVTKEATESGYDEVGDVIHYLITITNSGNVTLHDVIVTDLQVNDLECTPATPVPTLAPGASFTCTATHTITQQDLDIGFYFNEACTDDENGEPETGATPVCDDVTVFGEEVGGETDIPSQPPTDGALEGGSRPADGAWLLVMLVGLGLAAVVALTPARGRRRA